MKSLAPGLRYSAAMRVEDRHTVPQVSEDWPGFADMPPVFATAIMVGFIEQTCIEALRPYLSSGQHTVGTKIDISHTAPTPLGMEVTVTVELIAVDVRKLTFRVAAHDEHGSIGEGLHERFIIDHETFMVHVKKKQITG